MKRLSSQAGFTLLEVIIAFAVIIVVVAAAMITGGNGAAASARNRRIMIATNLARNLINEQELKYEGLPLERLPKSTSQNFPEPNQEYKWTITYDEVDFSALGDLLAKQSAKQNEGNPEAENQTNTVMNIFKEYLQKSIRRMNVTIEWPDGNGTSSQTFTQILVDYETELPM